MANLVDEYLYKKEFIVIIAGGRDFTDYRLLMKTCDYYLQDKVAADYKIIIVSGGARGADFLGQQYAQRRGYECRVMPADWDQYGKSAGYRRNEDMARIAHACICFWDGKSRGTGHMIDIAKRHGLITAVENY